MDFGNRLKVARKNKKLLQAEAAERVGIDDTTLSKYENNHSEPDNDTLRKLAELYDVSFDYLLGDRVKSETLETDLNDAEEELIQRIRKMSAEKRKLLFDVARTMEE